MRTHLINTKINNNFDIVDEKTYKIQTEACKQKFTLREPSHTFPFKSS